MGGDGDVDVYGDAFVKQQGLQRQAQHHGGRIRSLGGKLKIGESLRVVLCLNDPPGVKLQGKAAHRLQGGLSGLHAQHLGQLVLGDVAAQRPIGQQGPGQRVAADNGLPQGAVQLPGVEESLVGVDVNIGKEVVAAGLGGTGGVGIEVELQLAGGIEPRHPAGGGPGLLQNGVEGGSGAALRRDAIDQVEICAGLQGAQFALGKAEEDQ